MKKLVVMLIIGVMLLAGCQSVDPDVLTNNDGTLQSNIIDNTSKHTEPNESISLRNLAQLNEMRTMISCTDEETLNEYLRSIEGGGANNREDLISFINLVDSIPNFKLIDGNITWISRSYGISRDTGETFDILYISTEAQNGEWTCIEYIMSVKDISAEIAKRRENGEIDDSTAKGYQSADGKIKIHSEKKEKHPSGKGDTIRWTMEIDGIFATMVYYTNDASVVKAESVFSKAVSTTINSN